MYLGNARTLVAVRRLRAALCIVLACAASCSFDPEGTGSERVRRSNSSAADASDSETTAVDAGAGVRSGRPQAADGGADTTSERADAGATRGDTSAEHGGAGARVDSGEQDTAVDMPSVPAAGGGSAGTTGAPVVVPVAGAGAPDASAPMPDESDAGDDSDAGAEPSAGTGGAAGASGTAAGSGGIGGGRAGSGGRGGRGGAAGSAGGTGIAADDRELLLSLIEVTVSVLQSDADAQAGDLLATLGAATSVDPALLTRVLLFVQGDEDCMGRLTACESTCSLVRRRCDECTADEDCRAALRSTCGSAATECR